MSHAYQTWPKHDYGYRNRKPAHSLTLLKAYIVRYDVRLFAVLNDETERPFSARSFGYIAMISTSKMLPGDGITQTGGEYLHPIPATSRP